MAKYLIVRTDRVGDVLLTTPLVNALRANDPSAKIGWLVQPYTAPLFARDPDIDCVIVDHGGPVRELVSMIRDFAPDVAFVAFPRWRAVWALRAAGVARRIGPASKIYSLLLTDRVWQHRSEGKMNEADYNLELLRPLGFRIERFPTRLVLSAEEQAEARKLLEGFRISFDRPVVVLHPGSGGSSPRWPLANFMALGDRLQESGAAVVVTAGPGETYQQVMLDQMTRPPTVIPAGSVSLRELAAVFSVANLVVSNSTGPLHMAVAVGTPTVSIYSSMATCHPRRWGPYPAFADGSDRHAVAIGGETDVSDVTVERVFALCQQRLMAKPQTSPKA